MVYMCRSFLFIVFIFLKKKVSLQISGNHNQTVVTCEQSPFVIVSLCCFLGTFPKTANFYTFEL